MLCAPSGSNRNKPTNHEVYFHELRSVRIQFSNKKLLNDYNCKIGYVNKNGDMKR
jgi:hypothetical protein